jgi:hypothetical protein
MHHPSELPEHPCSRRTAVITSLGLHWLGCAHLSQRGVASASPRTAFAIDRRQQSLRLASTSQYHGTSPNKNARRSRPTRDRTRISPQDRTLPTQVASPARQDRGRYELEGVVRARRRAAIGIACQCPAATAGAIASTGAVIHPANAWATERTLGFWARLPVGQVLRRSVVAQPVGEGEAISDRPAARQIRWFRDATNSVARWR